MSGYKEDLSLAASEHTIRPSREQRNQRERERGGVKCVYDSARDSIELALLNLLNRDPFLVDLQHIYASLIASH